MSYCEPKRKKPFRNHLKPQKINEKIYSSADVMQEKKVKLKADYFSFAKNILSPSFKLSE